MGDPNENIRTSVPAARCDELGRSDHSRLIWLLKRRGADTDRVSHLSHVLFRIGEGSLDSPATGGCDYDTGR